MQHEKPIEEYLCRQVKKLGGIPYKFTSPNRRSVPDRLCVFPGGLVVFIEVKAPGKQPTTLQQKELDTLKHLGHFAVSLNTKARVDVVMKWVKMKLTLKGFARTP